MTTDDSIRRKGKVDRGRDPTVDPTMLEGVNLLDPTEEELEPDDETTNDTPGRRRVATGKKSETPQTMIERVESVLRMASLVAISVSVGLAAYQFYQGRIDERKERSVDLMNEWQGSPARQAYARISEALETRLDDERLLIGQATPGALAQIKYRIGEAMLEEWSTESAVGDSWSAQIDQIFDFYSEVEFCIRANLCEASLLTSYFGDEAQSFWEYFRPYAEARRESYFPDYGVAVENFVTQLEAH